MFVGLSVYICLYYGTAQINDVQFHFRRVRLKFWWRTFSYFSLNVSECLKSLVSCFGLVLNLKLITHVYLIISVVCNFGWSDCVVYWHELFWKSVSMINFQIQGKFLIIIGITNIFSHIKAYFTYKSSNVSVRVCSLMVYYRALVPSSSLSLRTTRRK